MNSVIKGASYVLAHTPQMIYHNGTTQTTERVVNPESEYLKAIDSHLRSYEDVVKAYNDENYTDVNRVYNIISNDYKIKSLLNPLMF